MHALTPSCTLSCSLLSLALLSACVLRPGKLGEFAETGESSTSEGDTCDDAPEQANPAQDQDSDGFADDVDLCPLTPSDDNSADADLDGIGDDCDNCRRALDHYNLDVIDTIDARMWVRNNPRQEDFDHDGIGDVCDNCVAVPNCDALGPDADIDPMCQTDANGDMLGDACVDADTMLPYWDQQHAAGPVGFGASDDFDQDGIINSLDFCPRQPLAATFDERIGCVSNVDCSVGDVPGTCVPTPAGNTAYCNHMDRDGDQVGDACDSCPLHPNPLQSTAGGMEVDDDDGDFVGADCETSVDCAIELGHSHGTYEDARCE